MKRIIPITVLLFLIIIATVMNSWALSVRGQVVKDNKNSDPVQGRQVYIGDYEGETDVNGNFVIWIEPGRYIVRVDGYGETRIEGHNEFNRAINFRPRQDRSLRVIVR